MVDDHGAIVSDEGLGWIEKKRMKKPGVPSRGYRLPAIFSEAG